MNSLSAEARSARGLRRAAQDKREAIVDAAVEVFLEFGYELASLDVVAARAGVSKQTIYNNFGDKQRLFNVSVQQARSSGDTTVEPPPQLLRDGDHLVEELAIVGHEFLKGVLAPRVSATRRLIIGEASRHPELRAACADTEALAGPRIVAWFAQRVEQLAADGVLDAKEPALVSRQFFGLLLQEGLAASGYGTHSLSPRTSERICRETAQLIARAYATRSDSRLASRADA